MLQLFGQAATQQALGMCVLAAAPQVITCSAELHTATNGCSRSAAVRIYGWRGCLKD
jgi:hypothetical protein